MTIDNAVRAAPSQMIGESIAANMRTAPITAEKLKRLLTIRSTTLDCVAPAKSDQAPMLMVREDSLGSMAGQRVYRFEKDISAYAQLPMM
jgi:hypothetical protein